MFNQLKVALATFQPHPAISSVDRDTEHIIEALAEVKVQADNPFWDDPAVDWASFDLVLPRTTWDYSLRHKEFFAWVDRCSQVSTLQNPPAVLAWNAYKDSYLTDLAAKGVSVVSTTSIAPGEPVDFPEFSEFVVKPNVGGGSRGGGRYLAADRAAAIEHVRQIQTDGLTAMVQPYLANVDAHGERALVFIKGEFLHAIQKNAVLPPGARPGDAREAHPGVRAYEPTEAELDLGRRALAAAPTAEALLYGRVDLVSRDGEDPMIMELELVEPNLFLSVHPNSMPVVVNAIAKEAEIAAARRAH